MKITFTIDVGIAIFFGFMVSCLIGLAVSNSIATSLWILSSMMWATMATFLPNTK